MVQARFFRLTGFGGASGAILVLLAALLARPAALQAQEADLSNVTVARPVAEEIVATVPISGSTLARQEALVLPQVAGYPIVELLADVGDSVAAGEVLARLDDRMLKAQLAQAKAERDRAVAGVRQAQSQINAASAGQRRAQQTQQRQEGLRERGTISAASLEEAEAAARQAEADYASAEQGMVVAQAALTLAEAQLQVAELNLDNAAVTAPVAGVISERTGAVGAIAAAAGEPLFRIVAGGDVELEGEVIETDLGRLAAGQPAHLRIAGVGEVEGEVRRVSPRVDPDTRLGSVRIEIEGEGLRTGLFGSGRVTVDRRQSLTVPSTAILTDEEGDYVLVVGEGGLLSRRDVVAGLLQGDRREVVEGLAAEDVVVARAGSFFGPGDRVNPVETPSGDAPQAAGASAGTKP